MSARLRLDSSGFGSVSAWQAMPNSFPMLKPFTNLQFRLTSLVITIAACCPVVHAQHSTGTTLQEVLVPSTREDLQGIADSASEGVVTSKQLRTRPLQRAGDLLEVVPGLIATQHAGEGKANQYFLRGFNLDHGTDFATLVDGVPVNLPTHGHGQGYTDLNFLIPELVESIRYRKGPYHAEDGDFSVVGSARIRTVRRLARPFGLVEAGHSGYRRMLVAGSVVAGEGDLLLAAERTGDDGPWTVPQDLRKTNLTVKYSLGSEDNGLSFGLTHYDAIWTSTDQVPQRAIDNGLIGRFDTLDPTTGGRTRRTGLNAAWSHLERGRRTQLNAYALDYSFDLFSNFTYYTRGCDTAPVPSECNSGSARDQFEQVDRRRAFGLSASRQQPLPPSALEGLLSYGLDFRRDNIGEVGLFDTSQRQRQTTVRSDGVRLDALGLWSRADIQLQAQWRIMAGLRWDRRDIHVDSSVAANGGGTGASLVSPKLSIIHQLSEHSDIYANWGAGFHSNDARGAVLRVDPRDGVTSVARATPLVRATGHELGARRKWNGTLVTTAALWMLQIDSELLFVGDAGTTEPSRPSLRKGIELSANWRPRTAWEVDADLSLTRARFEDGNPDNYVPGAMERIASLGITYASGPWTAGMRVRHFGEQALTEDNSIRGEGSTITNVRLASRLDPRTEITLDVLNLFDRKVNDVQYAYASRLKGESAFSDNTTPATLHLHPSIPRTVRLGLKILF